MINGHSPFWESSSQPSRCTFLSPPPRVSTMKTESQRPNTETLNAAIEATNLAEKVSSIAPAKAVFGSVHALLTQIRVDSLGKGRNDQSKESYVFATREMIRHARLSRGPPSPRSPFRLSSFSSPHPPHLSLERYQYTTDIFKHSLTQTSLAIGRHSGVSYVGPTRPRSCSRHPFP